MWDSAFSKHVTGTENSGAGGNTTVTLTVPTGEVWEVLGGMAYHDDAGGNREILWYAQAQTWASVRAVAASVPVYCYAGWDGTNHIAAPWAAPLRLYAGQTIQALCGTMAANKNVTIRLWVRFLRGINQAV